MKNLELSLMTTDYQRTHPLFSGAVSIKGAELNVCPPPVQGDACYKPVYEQFDIAEMSLSWYVMARCRGEPLIALPVFPLRMFIQPYLFCRNPAEIFGSRETQRQNHRHSTVSNYRGLMGAGNSAGKARRASHRRAMGHLRARRRRLSRPRKREARTPKRGRRSALVKRRTRCGDPAEYCEIVSFGGFTESTACSPIAATPCKTTFKTPVFFPSRIRWSPTSGWFHSTRGCAKN